MAIPEEIHGISIPAAAEAVHTAAQVEHIAAPVATIAATPVAAAPAASTPELHTVAPEIIPPAAASTIASTIADRPIVDHIPVFPPTGGVTLPPIIEPIVNVVARFNLQRIPSAIDPFGSSAVNLTSTAPFRLAATNRIFGGMQQIKNHIGLILQAIQQPKLPAQIICELHNPDGSAAARVQVQFVPSSIGATGTKTTVLTGDDGGFTLNMPANTNMPSDGIPLTIHGSNTNTTVAIPSSAIASNGVVGIVQLSVAVQPLTVSILAALQALVPTNTAPATATTSSTNANAPQVTLGEPGSVCVQSFANSAIVDRFPWGIFFRLIEPQMSIASQAEQQPIAPGLFNWLPIYSTQNQLPSNSTTSTFVDRIPVDQPLSVDGFRHQVAGIDNTGTFTADETVPMAASLGLGYVLNMSQQWTFQGLGLGDLVYSLPLAPGEQQQMAVFERHDTTFVTESESFSESEAQQQVALSDTSTNATVGSVFNELANGGSQFQQNSNSSSSGASGGFSLGFISFGGGGGSGSSSSSGSDSTWLSGQRSSVENATQSTHSSAENQAAARVNANRTGMRLASASESMDVTTKIITNHNHTRALTMQYWEVQRIYNVCTTVDNVTLTCLIPMQVVRFMPPGQPETVSNPSQISSLPQLLERYKYILRHMDVLQRAVPRRLRRGLELLAQIAADPTTVVDSSGSVAEDVISFNLSGSFLSCETIYISAVTKRNTRVGPVQLVPMPGNQPQQIPQQTFISQNDLVAWLTNQRQSSMIMLQGSLALPSSVNRTDIIGFEITRQFKTVSCTLVPPVVQTVNVLNGLFGLGNNSWEQASGLFNNLNTTVPQTVTLTSSNLEQAIGGPMVTFFYAAIEDLNTQGNGAAPAPGETYINDNLAGTVLPPQPYPVPALQVAPVVRYKDILEIEKSAQHVVRNTTRYSRVLWLSMTPEERAILLDGYTIGVPSDGLADASQMVPLLNCVQNIVLGTFGNSLIMPFIIPQEVSETMGIDPAQLTQALLSYQREAFTSPQSTIALPTKGVLGEAVLGHCPSAEKIDLTRFWNWQDAPADTAPGIGEVQLPTTTPSLTTGVTAPNSLTNLPPLINNLITAPQPNTSLLQAMGQQATSQPDFSTALTGQTQLASLMQNGQTLANSARSDALKTSQTLASQAMTTVAGLINSSMQSSQKAATNPTQNQTSQTGQKNQTNQTNQAGQKNQSNQNSQQSTQSNSQSSSTPGTGTLGNLGSLLGGSGGTSGAGGAASDLGASDLATDAGAAALLA